MKAFLFDTETTGLIANHTVKLDLQPSVIEFYGCLADLKTGEIESDYNTFIKPPKPLSDKPNFGEKKTITQITGITNEMLLGAPSFNDVASDIKRVLECAPVVIAHNMSFDREMIDIEFERIHGKISWPHSLCTVEQTTHIAQTVRLPTMRSSRFTLSNLHQYLFDEPFEGAHRARADVAALLRCCVELHKREVI